MCTQAASAAALSAAIDRASITRSATRGSATLYLVNRPSRRPSTYPQPGQARQVGRDPALGQADLLHALGHCVLAAEQELQQPQAGRVAEGTEKPGHDLHAARLGEQHGRRRRRSDHKHLHRAKIDIFA